MPAARTSTHLDAGPPPRTVEKPRACSSSRELDGGSDARPRFTRGRLCCAGQCDNGSAFIQRNESNGQCRLWWPRDIEGGGPGRGRSAQPARASHWRERRLYGTTASRSRCAGKGAPVGLMRHKADVTIFLRSRGKTGPICEASCGCASCSKIANCSPFSSCEAMLAAARRCACKKCLYVGMRDERWRGSSGRPCRGRRSVPERLYTWVHGCYQLFKNKPNLKIVIV